MFYTKTHIDILPKLYDSFKIRLTVQEMQVQSLGQEDPLEKEMAAHSFLTGKSHGQRDLMGYSLWGCKESDTTLQLNNNNNNLGYSPLCFLFYGQ